MAGKVDGDGASIKLSDGKIVNLRMAYGDAPETAKPEQKKPGQPFGEEATAYLESLVKGKKLTAKVIEPANEKNYWRPVVVLYADGKDVNKEMFEAGYYFKQKRSVPLEYHEAYSRAEAGRKGIYSKKLQETSGAFRARLFEGMVNDDPAN